MLELALHFIEQHGYVALFVLQTLGVLALPIPDEFLVAFAGYLCFKGQLHLVPTIGTAFVGASLGITLSYALGRIFGPPLAHRLGRVLHLKQESFDRAHQWAIHYGKWSLTFGYFVPGIRHLVGFTAGILELPVGQFWLYACPGALAWSATFAFMGFFLGEEWTRWARSVPQAILLAALILGPVAAAFLWLRRRRGRTQ